MKKARIPYTRMQIGKTINLYTLEVECRFQKSGYKTPFKIKKMIWYDEIADSDMFTPSCPHLHSIDGKYKLNVYTGEIYDIHQKRVIKNKKVSMDEIENLWNEPKFQEFATKMRQRYFETYPKSELPQIPVFS